MNIFHAGQRALRRFQSGSERWVTIVEADPDCVRFRYSDAGVCLSYTLKEAEEFLQPICEHCNMMLEDHANNGKCLYGPWSWK